MIITANSIANSVEVNSKFKPTYIRALKFITAMSGKTLVSDRGENADKYECTFTVVGGLDDISSLVTNLNAETGQIIIDTEGGKIFGSGIDYTGTFTCNVMNIIEYPIRDLVTALVTIKVRVVSPIVYNASIPTTLPELFYDWPVKRSINKQKTPFQALEQGDFGNSTRVDSTGTPFNSQSVTVRLRATDEEFGQLHRFVADKRGDTFTLNTGVCLELFLNSTSESVIITNFKYTPDGFKFWNVEMTMVNNV